MPDLRQSEYLLHEFETSFRNDGYIRLLARQDATFLMHPSEFVAIGRNSQPFAVRPLSVRNRLEANLS